MHPWALRAVRDHAEPRHGQGCIAVRVHLLVRAGAGRSSRVPPGSASTVRPHRRPDGVADERALYLSDILPTAWQAVAYADVPDDGTLAVLGLGPVGQLACRIALHQGVGRVIGVDPVPERRTLAAAHGVEAIDVSPELVDQLIDMTAGRGPDAVVEAVGMEAHGSPIGKAAHAVWACCRMRWQRR